MRPVPMSAIHTLPDELLRSTLRFLDGVALLRSGAACMRWRAVSEDVWLELCTLLVWSELAGMQNVGSYKRLWARICKLEAAWSRRSCVVAAWSPPPVPPQLQICVRLVGWRRPFKGRVLLAHVFHDSDMDAHGEFRCPPLNLTDEELLLRANGNTDYVSLPGIMHGCTVKVWAQRADEKICPLMNGREYGGDEAHLVRFGETHEAVGYGGLQLGKGLRVEAYFGAQSVRDPLRLDAENEEHVEQLDDDTFQWALEAVKPLRYRLKLRLSWCWAEDGPESEATEDFDLAMLHCSGWA